MGITSYAAFTPIAGGTMAMGDTVLLEDEVNPTMSPALDASLEVTALRNHFFFDQPKIYFMHIGGMSRLASAVKAVYDRIAQVRSAQASPSAAFPRDIPTTSNISAAPIEEVFGMKSQTSSGMVKVVIGRKATMHGVEVGNEMGVNTWAAFAGSDQQVVADGDFAMLEGELQTALKTMRADGINIVAIHQHMTQETPRYVFLHYWGRARPRPGQGGKARDQHSEALSLVMEGGGTTRGGIDVSGAPGGEADNACARAGIRAVSDILEF